MRSKLIQHKTHITSIYFELFFFTWKLVYFFMYTMKSMKEKKQISNNNNNHNSAYRWMNFYTIFCYVWFGYVAEYPLKKGIKWFQYLRAAI